MGGSIPLGRRRITCEMRACASCSATSTLRDRSSSTEMLALPCRDEEVIDRTPSTWVTASSMSSTTSCSITSGAAPSQVTEMLMLGKSTSGIWLMPMRQAATPPNTMVAAIIIQANTGLRMQTSVWAGAPLPATWTLAPSRSASAPRTTSSSPGLSPPRTSTFPSEVFIPSLTCRSCATSPSTTNAKSPRSLARIACWGTTAASPRFETGTVTSANAPGRSADRSTGGVPLAASASR